MLMDFDFVMALFSLPGQDSLDVRAEIMGSRRFGISVDARICSVLPKAPSVSMGPGAMPTARIPSGPHSRPSVRVMLSTAALAALAWIWYQLAP